ncbi:GGDEF domain-containing protein [Aliidiomarina sedimenti]|uniref:diguanylate cyclase n=1 Tax=Aliidiomarina sedimenti TaxID=1933879 RepID=A0ABY0BWP5_9GAMM|nr:GGDEF domain-containing protein [Aliidiomarina sedimenti]RUO28815.1 GGDEF domain-containing protein [Aliidiomarina sedimenti]
MDKLVNASATHTDFAGNTYSGTELLLQQLQKSLELESILNSYYTFIQSELDLLSLSYQHQDIQSVLMRHVAGLEAPCKVHQLRLNGNFLGELHYYFSTSPSKQQLSWLKHCEVNLLYPLHNALQFRRLRFQAVRDHLTNLGNRVLLDEVLQQLLTEHERHNQRHALVLLDLDNFKAVNDIHGHQCGDHVLAEFAAILQQQLRGSDRLFRYGGDEFLVIVDSPDEITLQRIFRRLQLSIDSHPLLREHAITCSAGAVFVKPSHDAESLLEDADKSLYCAKRNGRNQLVTPATLALTQFG